ncbi:hypothetical protein [Streptosporangium vulgare]|uniref:hypothetical protein n=1 Tax=Streptosporangium vulgare TaxID=46190 RepID=UPI0031E17CD5
MNFLPPFPQSGTLVSRRPVVSAEAKPLTLPDRKAHHSMTSSQSIGVPSDQTALSLMVYSTLSGSSETFSYVPKSLSGVIAPLSP